jgi:hypothetical protein
VLSDSPTPPLGVPKVIAFESRSWRDYLPSFDQWMVAAACVFAAAAVGFAIGRSSAPTSAQALSAAELRAVCPDPTTRPTTGVQPSGARDLNSSTEIHIDAPASSTESANALPVASAAPDPAAQQATEKAIARAMSRGARRAAACRSATSPSGTAHVTATFLPSGEVKTAIVRGAPFAGTAEGECIVKWFRPLRVPPFSGDNVTARRDVTLD